MLLRSLLLLIGTAISFSTLPANAFGQTYKEILCADSQLKGPADQKCMGTGYYSSMEGGGGRFRSFAIVGVFGSGADVIYSASLMLAGGQESSIRAPTSDTLHQLLQNRDKSVLGAASDWSPLQRSGEISYLTFSFKPAGAPSRECVSFSLLSGGSAYGYGQSLLGTVCRLGAQRFSATDVTNVVGQFSH